ncbi:hypothetical protein Chor_012676, partial [Crotalus horridus]
MDQEYSNSSGMVSLEEELNSFAQGHCDAEGSHGHQGDAEEGHNGCRDVQFYAVLPSRGEK